MKFKVAYVAPILAAVLLANPVFAKPEFVSVTNQGGHSFSLPAHAAEMTPNVFSLGTAYDAQSHEIVEGYAFIHKKQDNARTGNAKIRGGNTCYAFMASGAKWKNVENWTVFPGGGLSGSYIQSNSSANISKWESAAGANILGTGSAGVGNPSDPNVLDEKNEISFAVIPDSNTIAVTIVWGIFSGPTFNRKLVAWDQIYNTSYLWSMDATGSTTEMDFENISTHELGHAMGMDHPSNTCTKETMYAYADFGETTKRDLNTGDAAGIQALY